jgi:hypothetical protein
MHFCLPLATVHAEKRLQQGTQTVRQKCFARESCIPSLIEGIRRIGRERASRVREGEEEEVAATQKKRRRRRMGEEVARALPSLAVVVELGAQRRWAWPLPLHDGLARAGAAPLLTSGWRDPLVAGSALSAAGFAVRRWFPTFLVGDSFKAAWAAAMVSESTSCLFASPPAARSGAIGGRFGGKGARFGRPRRRCAGQASLWRGAEARREGHKGESAVTRRRRGEEEMR